MLSPGAQGDSAQAASSHRAIIHAAIRSGACSAPVVRVWSNPKGLPSALTAWPTRRSAEVPSEAGRSRRSTSCGGLICSTHKSLAKPGTSAAWGGQCDTAAKQPAAGRLRRSALGAVHADHIAIKGLRVVAWACSAHQHFIELQSAFLRIIHIGGERAPCAPPGARAMLSVSTSPLAHVSATKPRTQQNGDERDLCGRRPRAGRRPRRQAPQRALQHMVCSACGERQRLAALACCLGPRSAKSRAAAANTAYSL